MYACQMKSCKELDLAADLSCKEGGSNLQLHRPDIKSKCGRSSAHLSCAYMHFIIITFEKTI